ncbi:hypothetical protein Q1W73_16635 [Asticcacaulis sp. ZE23SCel15]|nr:hypothetical protein [Asticcacaulis sp. ZE23SCel15]WKL57271.1 hypothetical protein Q1W73_16635 [Asticcacaulis sp. ZE23SCel15]
MYAEPPRNPSPILTALAYAAMFAFGAFLASQIWQTAAAIAG